MQDGKATCRFVNTADCALNNSNLSIDKKNGQTNMETFRTGFALAFSFEIAFLVEILSNKVANTAK